MMDFKVEYLPKSMSTAGPINSDDVAYVRLAEVEKLIQEAEWAMELVFEQAPMFNEHTAKVMTDRSQAFLASIAAWRTGQEGTSE